MNFQTWKFHETLNMYNFLTIYYAKKCQWTFSSSNCISFVKKFVQIAKLKMISHFELLCFVTICKTAERIFLIVAGNDFVCDQTSLSKGFFALTKCLFRICSTFIPTMMRKCDLGMLLWHIYPTVVLIVSISQIVRL